MRRVMVCGAWSRGNLRLRRDHNRFVNQVKKALWRRRIILLGMLGRDSSLQVRRDEHVYRVVFFGDS